MARAYWKLRGRPDKTKVISRIEGYHGVTLAAMSATGLSAYWPLFEPRVPGFVHIPSPYPYRYEAPPGVSQGIAAADELERAIEREGAETVAMFLAEPVQGAGGVIVPQDDYFPRIREICDRHDVLLVADEVITGFGRTGTLFALDHWGVEPDIMQFAKAVTSGYVPFGGIGISAAIAATSTTTRACGCTPIPTRPTPSGARWPRATCRLSATRICPAGARARETGSSPGSALPSATTPTPADIRGKGLMCAVELVADRATKEPFPAGDKVGPRVQREAAERGLFSRVKADTYVLAPAAVITDDQVDRTVDILAGAIRAVLG